MSGALQTETAGSNGAGQRRLRVALVAAEGRGEEISLVLERQGFDPVLVAAAEDLLEAGADPALIALWVEGNLGKALSHDLAPLRRAMAQTPVVLVCSRIRSRDLRAALSAGAAGVVLEDELGTTLGPSLQAVGVGQVCVPQSHAEEVEPAALSPREKQILGLVVMGYMNGQIAEQLFVAESTVKSHLSSAFGKLGVRSRSEAAELIMDSERGLGVGILALGDEPLETIPTVT